MLMFIYFVVMVLLLFGITIFVHELGHFLVARKLGMQADVFSIGFGHAIWKKKVGDVVYKIGWIPFGGYVALPQMEPGGGFTENEEGHREALPRVAPWRKILVAVAGATGNILLAFSLAILIFWTGKPSLMGENSSVVGFVHTNSVAYAKGLRIGDEVIEVNGMSVTSWEDVTLQAAVNDDIDLVFNHREEERKIHLMTAKGALGVKGVKGLPGVDGPSYCVVDRAMPDSSAAKAGVQSGDWIVSLDGQRLFSIPHLIQLVEANRDQAVPMVVTRGGEELELTVTPAYDETSDRVLIGIAFDQFHMNLEKFVHPTPMQQIRKHAGLIFFTLRSMMTPKQAKNAVGAIGGPPMIFQYLYAMLKTHIIMALWFTCLLNVNLAIINLMPLPVLDGGHIVFALVELITRRPVHEKIVGALTTVFAILLIGSMLFLSYRDIDRILDARKRNGELPSKEEVAPQKLDPSLIDGPPK